jgi:general secretion pathway protein H
MTLIEMLVVLAIIGVIASVSVLALGTTGSGQGQAEARQLEARLQLAADQSMIEDSYLALRVEPTGYSFVEWDDARGAWEVPKGGPLAMPRALPAGMTLQASEPGTQLPLGAASAGRGFTLTLAQVGRTWAVDFDGATARLAKGRSTGAGAKQ